MYISHQASNSMMALGASLKALKWKFCFRVGKTELSASMFALLKTKSASKCVVLSPIWRHKDHLRQVK
ncbi:hypothetical protein HYC85_029188 [Camellia sinensis]|uniref:Uncharacterized protein n=1 Tax=Camellia sinensis TaxID=4442 RepID=A0A7J7FXZ2_CAMSI|nr:hypothetical protein HYC85_029188 [Camellia sinensis]